MPSQPTVPEIRLNNITTCLAATANTLEIVSQSLHTPFLSAISVTTRSLSTSIQKIKQNKNDCARLMEQTYGLLCAVIASHLESDTPGELPPSTLSHLGKFTETLHKIHTYVDAQQEGSRVKRFFRQGEMAGLLKECDVGLQDALTGFQVRNTDLLHDISAMERDAQTAYQRVLDMIESLSDGTQSETDSAMYSTFSASRNSSNLISLLPSEPKIFHGRESELADILKLFREGTPRIAILGAGGMGKTSLARAILHHGDMTLKYSEQRVFVACDAATSKVELAALIGAHLGLKPGRDLSQAVIGHFAGGLPALLILDNLETLWDPIASRNDIEEFLSLLTDIDHLALMITMRGAERPAKVKWSRPFLPPLAPLSQEAARKTFIDVADDWHDSEDIDKVLLLTDNMPLAISLVAHLVDSEGCAYVLSRWEQEKTSLVSEGYDRTSNLDLSIALSLSGPRVASFPAAKNLLSLLAILPDGLSDVELLQSGIPIENILLCKAVLLRTSLAYSDDQRRLKMLMPIREYMQKFHPPLADFIRPLLSYFKQLLRLHHMYRGTLSGPSIVAQLTTNFANMESILTNRLHAQSDLPDAIYSTIALGYFSRISGRGQLSLNAQIPALLRVEGNPDLEVYFTTNVFNAVTFEPIPDADALVERTLGLLPKVHDTTLQSGFYRMLYRYYRDHRRNLSLALEFLHTGLRQAIASKDVAGQCDALESLAMSEGSRGNFRVALTYAIESERLAKTSGLLLAEAIALRVHSMCTNSLGNYKSSSAACDRARELLALCGMAGGEMDNLVMNSQAEVHKLKTEYAQAYNVQTQILKSASAEEDPYRNAHALLTLAEIGVQIGTDTPDVQANIDKAITLFTTMTMWRHLIWCETIQADLSLRDGDCLAAEKLFLKSLKSSRGEDLEIVCYCLERLGDPNLWSTGAWSSTWTVVLLVQVFKLEQKLELYRALQFLGDLFLVQQDENTAVTLFSVALEGFTRMDVHRGRADCLLRLGDVCRRNRNLSKAVQLWTTARPLFERSSQTKRVADIDERLGATSEGDATLVGEVAELRIG
ncbi:hypothetical protein B0H16DRAFT_59196 [Mycena metata]|uniref:Novel STAND NTPase 1 domain-containing protein n=1 Tax=Mycena metata TaxID=1033252 RepID=A0AAD7ICP7_9AGAR|nr:hypothetical protein B0H16DRAFT_59196 [Mycena metata]